MLKPEFLTLNDALMRFFCLNDFKMTFFLFKRYSNDIKSGLYYSRPSVFIHPYPINETKIAFECFPKKYFQLERNFYFFGFQNLYIVPEICDLHYKCVRIIIYYCSYIGLYN
jgi:hypothetical protein